MLSIRLIAAMTLLILFTFTSNSGSQCTSVYTFDGEAAGDVFGQSIASAGDVNGDGYDDLITGTLYNDANGKWAGRAYVFSGKTGDTLYVFSGANAGDLFGHSSSTAGDVNNDGYDDIIIGAYGYGESNSYDGRAYVFSGKTGDTLFEFTNEFPQIRLGFWVSTAGDVNNDGYDDVMVSADLSDVTAWNTGRVYIFSGKDGNPLYIFDGEASGDYLGKVSDAGDVNNDGFDDFIISVPLKDIGGADVGRVYVFSGKTGDTLHVFSGEAAGDRFGNSISSAGDVNNDGYDDIIIGADYYDGVAIDAGRAYVFSGKTGDTLYVLSGKAEQDRLGASVSSAGDIDNDGYDDLIIGVRYNDGPADNGGRAYIISGKTGDTLIVLNGESPGDQFGFPVSDAGDVNNDGFDDVIITAHMHDAAGLSSGRVYVYMACGYRGDVNYDGADANILDLTYLVNFIFRGGPAALCAREADVDGDGYPSLIMDLTFLVDRIFRGGPAPGLCD